MRRAVPAFPVCSRCWALRWGDSRWRAVTAAKAAATLPCSPNIRGSMSLPIPPTTPQTDDLPAHTPMMAQYQRVTLPVAQSLGFVAQVFPPVPLECPCCLAALACRCGHLS